MVKLKCKVKTLNDEKIQHEIMVMMHTYIICNSMEITHLYLCKYFFLNEQTQRLTDNYTKSRSSTFYEETAGNNADNLWSPMLKPRQNLIWLKYF